jgi:hypothetical protein
MLITNAVARLGPDWIAIGDRLQVAITFPITLLGHADEVIE